MTNTLTVRMDEELGGQFSSCLSRLGLTANTYFVMAAKQLVTQGRVPFEIIVPAGTPTKETRAALVLAQAKELGLVPDDSPHFDTAEAAMAFLEAQRTGHVSYQIILEPAFKNDYKRVTTLRPQIKDELYEAPKEPEATGTVPDGYNPHLLVQPGGCFYRSVSLILRACGCAPPITIVGAHPSTKLQPAKRMNWPQVLGQLRSPLS